MHFSMVLLVSMHALTSWQIFVHVVCDSRLCGNWWFSAHNWISSRFWAWLQVSYLFPFFLLLSLSSVRLPALLGSSTGVIDDLGNSILMHVSAVLCRNNANEIGFNSQDRIRRRTLDMNYHNFRSCCTNKWKRHRDQGKKLFCPAIALVKFLA